MPSLNEWIDRKVKDGDINYFDYSELSNVRKIDNRQSKSVKRADWLYGRAKIALKPLVNNSSIKENHMDNLLIELNNLTKVSYHPNINQFYGVTKVDPSSSNYMMVLQFANQGNLREYLKDNFYSLQWNDKIQMALDISRGLKCLHSRNIVHRDLHAKNILVHKDRLMVADLGLSKQLTVEVISTSYVEPQFYGKGADYIRNKKSDIYSLGILLWEISSGRPPYLTAPYYSLIYKVSNGLRELPIIGTPSEYINLYQRCWDEDPSVRPTIEEVIDILGILFLRHSEMNTTKITVTENVYVKSEINNNNEKNEKNEKNENNNNYLRDVNYENDGNNGNIEISGNNGNSGISGNSGNSGNNGNNELPSQPHISKKDISEPLPSNALLKHNEFENELLSGALDEIIQVYVKYNKYGWTNSFDFDEVLEKYKSKSRKIFDFLIDNPSIQHYEVIIGKFYGKGFGIDKNEIIAFQWYAKANQKHDIYGFYEVGYCYYSGRGAVDNNDEAFKYCRLAANKGLNIALDFLATCYEYGYGAEKDYFKAFELYKMAAKNGFVPSQYELARCYRAGNGTHKNMRKALKWYKAYQRNDGINDISSKIEEVEKELERGWFKRVLKKSSSDSFLNVTV